MRVDTQIRDGFSVLYNFRCIAEGEQDERWRGRMRMEGAHLECTVRIANWTGMQTIVSYPSAFYLLKLSEILNHLVDCYY